MCGWFLHLNSYHTLQWNLSQRKGPLSLRCQCPQGDKAKEAMGCVPSAEWEGKEGLKVREFASISVGIDNSNQEVEPV